MKLNTQQLTIGLVLMTILAVIFFFSQKVLKAEVSSVRQEQEGLKADAFQRDRVNQIAHHRKDRKIQELEEEVEKLKEGKQGQA